MGRNSKLAAVLAAAAAVAPAPVLAAPIMTGTATYDLVLDTDKTTVALGSVTGTVVTSLTYECDAYHSDSTFSLTMVSPEGVTIPLSVHHSMVEKTDSMEFSLVGLLGSKEYERAKGVATRTANGLTVALTEPEAKTLSLPGDILFPVAATEAAIVAAEAGKHLTETAIFDGTGHGKDVVRVSVLIGPAGKAEDGEGSQFERALGFEGLMRWRMTFTYFSSEAGDQASTFSTAMIVFENGFAEAAAFNIGPMVLQSRLTETSLIPPKPCGKGNP